MTDFDSSSNMKTEISLTMYKSVLSINPLFRILDLELSPLLMLTLKPIITSKITNRKTDKRYILIPAKPMIAVKIALKITLEVFKFKVATINLEETVLKYGRFIHM